MCVDIRVCRDGGRAKVRTEEGGRSVKTKAYRARHTDIECRTNVSRKRGKGHRCVVAGGNGQMARRVGP